MPVRPPSGTCRPRPPSTSPPSTVRSGERLPGGVRLLGWAAERGQVHAHQRDRGQKIAITSSRPQTTRHTIRGVVHRPDAQLVLVDTPGLHRPRTLLGERLNDLVRQTWSEVDVIGLCLPADEEIGRGDRFITGEIAGLT